MVQVLHTSDGGAVKKPPTKERYNKSTGKGGSSACQSAPDMSFNWRLNHRVAPPAVWIDFSGGSFAARAGESLVMLNSFGWLPMGEDKGMDLLWGRGWKWKVQNNLVELSRGWHMVVLRPKFGRKATEGSHWSSIEIIRLLLSKLKTKGLKWNLHESRRDIREIYPLRREGVCNC